jgi:hypothetical protein
MHFLERVSVLSFDILWLSFFPELVRNVALRMRMIGSGHTWMALVTRSWNRHRRRRPWAVEGILTQKCTRELHEKGPRMKEIALRVEAVLRAPLQGLVEGSHRRTPA